MTDDGRTVARSEDVRAMFSRVAPSYDLINTLMTFGMDRRWRSLIQRRAGLRPNDYLLDLATGTGQLAFDARRSQPDARIVAGDLTREMVSLARQRPGADTVSWIILDAQALPFADETFDVITHGYLLRYLGDLVTGLVEQFRVLRPGGRVVALETSPRPKGWRGAIAAAAARCGPVILGGAVAGNIRDYAFLQESTLTFCQPEQVRRAFEEAGFVQCGNRSFMLGMLTVHWAHKP